MFGEAGYMEAIYFWKHFCKYKFFLKKEEQNKKGKEKLLDLPSKYM